MNLGDNVTTRALFYDASLALEIKEVITQMGDQINDTYWDRDKRRQQYTHHSDTRSIIYKWTEIEDTIGETFVTDYTPPELSSKVYLVVDKIIKCFNNPRGIEHGPRTKVVRLILAKLKPGGHIPPHEDYFNLLLTHRVHFVIQSNDSCIFTIDGQETIFPEGTCFELNNSKTHSVINNGEQDRIHLICDILFE